MKQDLFQRFQRWLIAAIAIGALIYLGGSIWAGFSQMKEQFQIFEWVMFVYAIGLTLSNYALRFVKWHYLLGRLNVKMPLIEDMWTFTAGLSMAISSNGRCLFFDSSSRSGTISARISERKHSTCP